MMHSTTMSELRASRAVPVSSLTSTVWETRAAISSVSALASGRVGEEEVSAFCQSYKRQNKIAPASAAQSCDRDRGCARLCPVAAAVSYIYDLRK